jgi:hypothetical protein
MDQIISCSCWTKIVSGISRWNTVVIGFHGQTASSQSVRNANGFGARMRIYLHAGSRIDILQIMFDSKNRDALDVEGPACVETEQDTYPLHKIRHRLIFIFISIFCVFESSVTSPSYAARPTAARHVAEQLRDSKWA